MRETFYSVEQTGVKGAMHKINALTERGYRVVDVSHGYFRQWGSAVPCLNDFSPKGLGWRITVVR